MATSKNIHIYSNDVLKELIEKLPDEIVTLIISKLGPKMLGQCKTLSPTFRDLVSSQFVVRKSNHQIPLQLEVYDGGRRLYICNVDEHGLVVTKKVLSFPCELLELQHCNGLVGYYSENRRLSLCNLTTSEEVQLRSVHPSTKNQHFFVGYDPFSKLHKVVVWLEQSTGLESYPSEGMILTLEEGTSWRPVLNLPRVKFFWERSQAVVSGTVFWLVGGERYLRTFNLRSETFGTVELPRGSLIQTSEEIFRFSLTEFEGCLCWVVQASCARLVCNPLEILDMWILKDLRCSDWIDMTPQPNVEVPMEDTNLKEYYEGELGPIVYPNIAVHNGGVMIAASDNISQYIFWYSPLNGQYKRMQLSGIDILSLCLKKHVNSSLNFSKLLCSSLLHNN